MMTRTIVALVLLSSLQCKVGWAQLLGNPAAMGAQKSLILALVVFSAWKSAIGDELPPGYVQGDEVVSYSYVPNKRWTPREALGSSGSSPPGAG